MITESYKTDEVFTPTTPARLTFVEREGINNKLVNALKTPGKQIIVYGHSGSGKTTLLENKLYQTYERHITTRCIKGLTFEQLMLDAFDQLNVFYEVESTKTNRASISSNIASEYYGIKAQIGSQVNSEKSHRKQRVVPPQLTPQTLARFLGEANLC